MNFQIISLNQTVTCFHYFFNLENCLYKATHRPRPGLIYLTCIERACRCKAKICGELFERTNDELHNHANHVSRAEFERVYEQLRNAVREDRRPVRELHRDALRTLTADAAGMMAWTHCRKTLQRIRHALMPPCRSLAEMVDLLEENDDVYASFGTLRGAPFYQGTVNGQLVFANLELVRALGENINIFIDGTFKCTPFRAEQLLVILGEVQGRPRPLIYAIMTGRSENDYFSILAFVQQAVFSNDGIARVPRLATSDFEQAIRGALVKVWPTIELVGCNFHFCQCLRRKAASMPALSTKITGGTLHHRALVMFMRLSLLPLPRVDAGFEAMLGFIEDNGLSNDFGEFINYFRRTWFGRYPKETWCVSDRERRSNNHLEGYNSLIKRSIPQNPSPWVFLDSLLNLAYDASASFTSDRQREAGPPPDRSSISAPLQDALELLLANRINELGFLAMMATV
jgi:MULE transposase domain